MARREFETNDKYGSVVGKPIGSGLYSDMVEDYVKDDRIF